METRYEVRPVVSARRPRVLHVTESYGGGVASAVRSYVASVPDVDHYLLFAERADAPVLDGEASGFVETVAMPPSHLARARTIRQCVQEWAVEIIHAHSSFAGVYVRLGLSGRSTRIVYTPHCYSFERRDIGAMARLTFRALEASLTTRTSTFAACSPREARISRRWWGSPTVVYVPNVTDYEMIPLALENYSNPESLVIAGAGRIGAQKDPRFFVEAIASARSSGIAVTAVWIGGGKAQDEAWLASHGIRVTGWLDHQSVRNELAACQIYLHSAAWEGFPIAILEASALGIPSVVRRIPAFDDIKLPIQVSTPAEFSRSLIALQDAEARRDLVANVRAALDVNTRARQRSALLNAWQIKLERE